MNATPVEYLTLPDGSRLAFHATPARHGDPARPGVVFLGGFMSDMTGDKATTLEAWAQQTGHAFLRLDYSGHGASDGAFRDGTIGRWVDDAVAVVAHCGTICAGLDGPLVLVGSSMGGWIMLRVAQHLAATGGTQHAAGLVGIAAAPDFTEDLMPERLGPEVMATIARDGLIEMASDYSDNPYIVTRRLIEDGRDQLVLRGGLDLAVPLRLLHGTDDADVPWSQSKKLLDAWAGDDATLTLVRHGDHRLSTPRDLARLAATVAALCEEIRDEIPDGIAGGGSSAGQ